MECRKWEETGLLYSVQELSGNECVDYEVHLEECGYCRSELDRYREERKRFFTRENLCGEPSPHVDAEILRVCSNCRRNIIVKAPSIFPAFFRKAFVPVALILVGFISVGYIMLNVQNAGQINAASNSPTSNVKMAATVQPSAIGMNAVNDSLKDSLSTSKVNYAKTRGNLNGQEAIPVDLLKDK